jgi:anti-sigma factor RsiW
MNTSFTPEDLLEYLYKETSPERTQAIEEALRTDWSLREKMAVLQTSQERLDRLMESPRTETILRLLRYAAAENVAARY